VLPTQTPTVTNQSNPIIEGVGVHIVAPDETLTEIASQYGVFIEDFRLANAMIGDTILPGQRLRIPVVDTPVPQPWRFSIIEGDLNAAYQQVLEQERFTLHYTPETYPAQDPEILAQLVQRGLEHIEKVMSAQLLDHFDVYIAGSVFAPPNRTLRGRTFSYRWQTFFLHDGTGNAADQPYIATHELTHLFAWNVFGQPVSIMLSEGVAVYTGMKAIADSNHIPINDFCLAYLHAGKLPAVSTSLSFQGHNIDLINYYTAGCFVGYLIETYGPNLFGQLYSTEDYYGIYGRSLPELEKEWREQLASQDDLEVLNPTESPALVEEVTASYASFFSSFTGTAIQINAYRELDNARIALLEGRFEAADQSLTLFHEYLGGR
jgi:LysM repeat protein